MTNAALLSDKVYYSQERSDFQYENYTFGLGDTLAAQASSAMMHNPTQALNRLMSDRFFVDEEPTLSIEEANTRFGIGDLKFSEPVTEERAQRMAYWKKKEIDDNEVLRKGSKGFVAGAAKFGTSLGASLLDPINIASGLVMSPLLIGAARAAKTVATGVAMYGPSSMALRTGITIYDAAVATESFILGKQAGTIGGRAAFGVTEGAIGAAIVEPLPYYAAQRDQLDYSLTDSLLNVTVGGVLGGGLHGLARGLEIRGEKIQAAKEALIVRRNSEMSAALSKLPEATRMKLLDETMQSVINDKFPVVLDARVGEELRRAKVLPDRATALPGDIPRSSIANIPDINVRASVPDVKTFDKDAAVLAIAKEQNPDLYAEIDNLKNKIESYSASINDLRDLDTVGSKMQAALDNLDKQLAKTHIKGKERKRLASERSELADALDSRKSGDTPAMQKIRNERTKAEDALNSLLGAKNNALAQAEAEFKRTSSVYDEIEIKRLAAQNQTYVAQPSPLMSYEDALKAYPDVSPPAMRSQPKDMFVPENAGDDMTVEFSDTDLKAIKEIGDEEVEILKTFAKDLPDDIQKEFDDVFENMDNEIREATEIADNINSLGYCVTRT